MAEAGGTTGKEKVGEQKWGGTMTCHVANETGGYISNVTATHEWDDRSQQLGRTGMDVGESAPFEILVGSGGHDLWSIIFMDESGRMCVRHGKQCDVTSGDLSSGGPVYLNLGPYSRGFSVVLPDSSSCIDNSYD